MMGSDFEEEEDRFYDADEELSSGSDFSGDFNIISPSISRYEVWTKCPDSIRERRRTFMETTGLSSSFHSVAIDELEETDKEMSTTNTMPQTNEPVISNCVPNGVTKDGSSSSSSSHSLTHSSMSLESDESVDDSAMENGNLGKNLVCTVQDSENPSQYAEYVMEVEENGAFGSLREVGSNRLISLDEFERSFSSRLVQQLLQKQDEEEVKKKEKKENWIKKLSTRVRKNIAAASVKAEDLIPADGPKSAMRKVRVNASKKSFKEMTSLHTRQEFQAHKGSILTMKFSLDGKYLATAGKDGIVRVWKVNEDSRLDESDVPDDDPSCLYFPMNQTSKVGAFDVNKEKLKKLRKARDLACAVLPPEVFWMLERPLHEFHGHKAEVLDLSWSQEGYLLSSSVDKTVRLWKLGCDECQKVFPHKNYVTCVSFNPVNGDYFISGSIDGIVRLWEISGCQVVDYIDVREIVTAMSYRPNGKKLIVGSISGTCYFIDIVDNHLHLGSIVSLMGKKKKLAKRITGFQFCPSDPKKVMVTAADSLIKVLSDEGVSCKFKGPWKAGIHISASFTSDGKHVISTSEDSNVCVWNYNSLEKTPSGGPNEIRSCESFLSDNASIAIPWRGTRTPVPTPEPRIQRAQTVGEGKIWRRFFENRQRSSANNRFPAPDLERTRSAQEGECFPSGRPLFGPRGSGSGTWPEEKVMGSFPWADSVGSKWEYKVLKSAWESMLSSDNMWGAVIVTAGTDGRIRTYQNYGLPRLKSRTEKEPELLSYESSCIDEREGTK